LSRGNRRGRTFWIEVAKGREDEKRREMEVVIKMHGKGVKVHRSEYEFSDLLNRSLVQRRPG